MLKKRDKRYQSGGEDEIGIFQKFSMKITESIGNGFYRFGFLIAKYPWYTVLSTLLLVALFSIGLLNFRIEKDPLELWIPKDASYIQQTKWIIERIQYINRPQMVLITSPNVLEPDVLRKIAFIHNEIVNVTGHYKNATVIDWDDVCLKVPYIAEIVAGVNQANNKNIRKRRQISDDGFSFGSEFDDLLDEVESTAATSLRDPSVDVNPAVYCKLVDKIPLGCYEMNFAELWKYDENEILKLTMENIIEKLGKTNVGPITGHDTDFSTMLGSTKRDIFGKVTSAKAVMSVWFLRLKFSEVDLDATGNLAGTETWATEESMIWEKEFIRKMENLTKALETNETKIYYSAQRSFGDISQDSMLQDYDKFIIGAFCMFVYVELVLSKFSWTEIRVTLGSLGMLSVLFAFISSCGLCSALGIPYGPVHTSLPFLLMGLGVDDMFVMMSCWRKSQDRQKPIEERMGLMLKQAGAAITVTSLTDMVAFFVGSTTVLPSLQAFCLYAAVGILLTYLFAITFFVAIFTLDEYRIEAKINSIIPCIKHTDERGTRLLCDAEIMESCLSKIYTNFILTKPGKIIVIMTTLLLTGLSIDGMLKLEQKFDPNWFIPENTYLQDFIKNTKHHFPESGNEAMVFFGQLNYTESLSRIHNLVEEMNTKTDLFYKVNDWIIPFYQFVQINYHKDLVKEELTDFEWRFYLSKFLHSKIGGRYQANFRFDGDLKCGSPTPNVTLSWIDFKFRRFNSRNDYVPVMHEIQNMVERKAFKSGDGIAFAWAKIYANWLTDEIIDREVLRNVCLALVCVMFCTIFVIVNIQMCFWILLCVVITLINICGFMQRWGLTIDLVSCIALQLAIGLCVDYAAHIGQAFLQASKGDRTERALTAVKHIGSAVLNGGGSTLLAVAFLGGSKAYVFQSFFKIFLLVIIFGLFHGIVFLPVILSYIGPAPMKFDKSNNVNDDAEELKTMNRNGKTSGTKCDENSTNNESDKLDS